MAVGWLLTQWFSSLWNCIITRGVKPGRQASCWASCRAANVLHLGGAVVCRLFRTITSITTGHIQWSYITDNRGDRRWCSASLSPSCAAWVAPSTTQTSCCLLVCPSVCQLHRANLEARTCNLFRMLYLNADEKAQPQHSAEVMMILLEVFRWRLLQESLVSERDLQTETFVLIFRFSPTRLGVLYCNTSRLCCFLRQPQIPCFLKHPAICYLGGDLMVS